MKIHEVALHRYKKHNTILYYEKTQHEWIILGAVDSRRKKRKPDPTAKENQQIQIA